MTARLPFRFLLPLQLLVIAFCFLIYAHEKSVLQRSGISNQEAEGHLDSLLWKLAAGATLLILFSSLSGPLLGAGESYSEMAKRLEKIFRSQRRFLADASHELRTPLTVMRGEMEVLLARERGLKEYREQIQSTLEEVERLTRLVNNLLMLAEFDSGQWIGHFQTVDLRNLCLEMKAKISTLTKQKNITLSVNADQVFTISGDRLAMERVLMNLLDNAVRHTPEGKTISIRLTQSGDRVFLAISDEGVGIAAGELAHIFDRFYRVDKARAREQGGTGLGLSIVKSIVEAHKGTIDVESEAGKGTTFTLRFKIL